MIASNSFRDDLDIIVKSFNRPLYVERLVKSWNARWPDVPLTIVDDSSVKMEFDEPWYRSHRIVRLPADQGASYGRNYGVSMTQKPYILFLDDDFIICEGTDILNMLSLFSLSPDVGVVGGVIGEREPSCVHEGGLLTIQDKICYRIGLGNKNIEYWNDIPYRFCELTQQFIVADRRLFDDAKWDNALKTSEHVDFFLAIKNTKWKVIFTPSSRVDHRHDIPSPNYFEYRHGRQGEFRSMIWKKYALKEEVYEDNGMIQKRWISPEMRIEFDASGKLKAINRRLYGYIVVKCSGQRFTPGETALGTVISVGEGIYDTDGRPAGCPFKMGDQVYYRMDRGQQLTINGEECVVLLSSEVWTAR